VIISDFEVLVAMVAIGVVKWWTKELGSNKEFGNNRGRGG
jgi:hypothetical protein